MNRDAMMRSATAVAALAACAGVTGAECVGSLDATTHDAIAPKGVICGHDFGKPLKQVQKRNDPCMCGSGKKAKRCCVFVVEADPNAE